MKPSYYTCGAGSETNCKHFDDVNGCWRGCESIGDKNCDQPEEENYEGDIKEYTGEIGG